MNSFKIYTYLLHILLSLQLFANPSYSINPYVDARTWQTVAPFFLPEDHPIRPELDQIFYKRKVVANQESLKKAGFKNLRLRELSKITVASHPKIDGYLCKILTDDVDKIDHLVWLNRIKGAKSIEKAIAAHGYKKIFRVPKKWIYPLPSDPACAHDPMCKNFILVVEDMNILDKKANRAQWRGPFMTEERLFAIFTIIQELGLDDSVMCSNLPFDHKGRQVFIDTEKHHSWPVPFQKLTPYLPSQHQPFWNALINH